MEDERAVWVVKYDGRCARCGTPLAKGEYKGKRADLKAAYKQLLDYREDLENPPLLIGIPRGIWLDERPDTVP